MRADDDGESLTREEILARYGWREGEKEQVEAAMAARQKVIDRARIDAELRRPREAVVTKSYPRAAAASMSKGWQDYIEAWIKQEARATEDAMSAAIRQTLDKRDAVLRQAIAQFVVDRLKEKLHARDAELDALHGELKALRGEMREEFASLRRDFDALRYKRDRAALDIIEERIEQLEENSGERRLKLIG